MLHIKLRTERQLVKKKIEYEMKNNEFPYFIPHFNYNNNIDIPFFLHRKYEKKKKVIQSFSKRSAVK